MIQWLRVLKSYDEQIKTIPTNFNEKNITLLIAVIIYCYVIKYQGKQKHLLPFHDTKLKQFCVGSINYKWVLKI